MGIQGVLPFPRGSFLHDGVTGLINSSDVEGWIGQVIDHVADSVHKTGREVSLRIVKNDSGGDLTVARKGVYFSTDAGEWGSKIKGFCNADGQVGKPIDDAYTVGVTWPANAIGYLVEEGPCDALSDASALDTSGSSSSAVGSPIQWASGGTIANTVATTGDYVVGHMDETQAATNTAYRVIVQRGLANYW